MKYFTKEQLIEEIRPLSDLALEALEAGYIERLHYLLNEMSVAHNALEALGLEWLVRMFGEIRSDMGEVFLDNMLKESTAFLMEPYAEDFLKGDEKQLISELISIWRCQSRTNLVPVSETDDHIVFLLSPCGSGGRLVLEGWGEDGTPIFCRGCKALQKALNDACGRTFWETRISDTVLGACEVRFHKLKSKGQKLFDRFEIYQIAKPRCKQALEKLLARDLNIKQLIKDQHHEWMPWHDIIVQWATCILSVMYTEKGSDYLDKFLKETYNTAFSPFYQICKAIDDISLFRMFVRLWHYHMFTYRVEEEEDRFTFILDPCGSGGRLYRSNMHKGKFRYGSSMACLMDEPSNINFNRTDFPVYCTHCASSNRDQFEGNPLFFIVDGDAMKDVNSPCIHYLYKKGAKREVVEPRLLAQVGMSEVNPLRES